jgi:protocatechuate 4,5-dioxygenase alpha chain
MHDIPETPLFDGARSLRGYKLNKMTYSLGVLANREAFIADEPTYLARSDLSEIEKPTVQTRDWREMARLGGNLFFIMKITTTDPTPITPIRAAPATSRPVPSIGVAMDRGL